ncbi:hypothetical protein Vadar_020164 [Vaccinium darrowii]|uniref:Uncharacterized protein n=1 Tax=Vaccinium darrowii TaxID=229202 RepID=A0ACB7X254_9ERIC|nr:hypothetical protein Vadar_020164 [Vaccinium darrowii]
MPPPIPPNKLEVLKNSVNMSSAFRGVNINVIGLSPVKKYMAPPSLPGPQALGGGTTFNPSSLGKFWVGDLGLGRGRGWVQLWMTISGISETRL